MKTQLIGILLAALNGLNLAIAAPVMNMNTPGAQTITLYPDHLDKNLHYIVPSTVMIPKNEQGVPRFQYVEGSNFWGTKKAIISVTLHPQYQAADVEAVRANVLKINPNAQFTVIPFSKSKITIHGSLAPYVDDDECEHIAGVIGQEQSCIIKLNSIGRKVFLATVTSGQMFAVDLSYEIDGMIQQADGTYKNSHHEYQVSGSIGGVELSKHPQLFINEEGKLVDINKIN